MKAIGIIGYHHTGKTTAACALISELVARGYRVNSIKDIHDEKFSADKAGSNSDKHAKAGSSIVWARGLRDGALIFPKPLSYHDMLPHFDCDFLIIEGLKSAPVPKIVCAETTDQLDELIDDTTIGISGLIADKLESYRSLPVFCLQKNLSGFVDLIIEQSFKALPDNDPECCSACGKTCYELAGDIVQKRSTRDACVADSAKELVLMADGKEIVIVPFVQKLLKDNILSFVSNLKGVDPDAMIELRIDPRRKS